MEQPLCQYSDSIILEDLPDDGRSIMKGHVTDGGKLIEATLTALETGSLMPLIKQELKYTILSRRLTEGKSEIKVSFNEPKKLELTPVEILKKENRREQNRIASRKLRRKQKLISPRVVKRIHTLEASNTKLEADLRQLKAERKQLLDKVYTHMTTCSNKQCMKA